MSYQVLARKWRPQQFRDMIGQDHVVKALCNALDTNRLHHAYLFTGMRGVGKTTIARVFAKSLNCETKGVSSEPCGECGTCQDIEAGRFFDLIEVDAASKTGVDNTRELLENVPYAPSSGRYKVYLIDEVHMFSTSSFNALLKTLEEPPEHVKFILATTDPQKVPVTVLSRCLQFNLKALPEDALAAYLADLLQSEDIESEPMALAHIARASEGSVRDSLSLVEQAAAIGGGKVLAANVETMLGRLSPERLFDLADALAAFDAATVLGTIDALADYSPDYRQMLGELLSVLHQVALCQSLNGKVADGALNANPGAARITELAKTLSGEDVQLFYQIGLHGRRDMPHAPDQRGAFEMTLLRMLAFRPAVAGEHPAAVVAPTTATTPATTSAQVGAAAPQPAITGPASAPTAIAQAAAATQSVASTVQASQKSKTENTQKDEQPLAEKPPAKPAVAKIDLPWTPENWPAIVKSMALAGMPGQLAGHCTFRSLSDNNIALALETEHEHLNNPRFVERLQNAVSQARSEITSVSILLESNKLDTPARQHQRRVDDAMSQAQDAIRQDPLVQTLLEKVDGTVDESSVEPLHKPD